MSTSTPPWRGPSSAPPATGPAWRAEPPRAPYRPRWRRLALAAALAIAALAATTWVVFWLRPPAPARVLFLTATYDRTLAVPPNPFAKGAARDLAALTRPGSWFGTRARLNGGSPTPLSRLGIPDLSANRDKCVAVFVAAHGGRDRDGPFLFPEDGSGAPNERVRVRTLIDQLAQLPAGTQKLLILDATAEPAFADLGLVHNDFAAAVEELEPDIAAVPNLAVWLASGPDERSWAAPEWGASAFAHFVARGLSGAADADGNKRVTAGELVGYVTPRVGGWVRDNRGARQVPVLLPKADGATRTAGMHLVSVDGEPPVAAPEPFEPPPELEALWAAYRELAAATPPPTAYTPHLWRQYESWTLRHEKHVLANDPDGARAARDRAGEVRRQIEAARPLDVSPQTLTLQAAVGGRGWVRPVPPPFAAGIRHVAARPPADRAQAFAAVRDAAGDSDANRLLWGRALVAWAAEDPLPRLSTARELVPLVADGLAFRPAELNFLAQLARYLPARSQPDLLGQLLKQVLTNRLKAEEVAALLTDPAGAYPFAEVAFPAARDELARVDASRRSAEDLCFATDEDAWRRALDLASADIEPENWPSADVRFAVGAWHRAAHHLGAFDELAARRGPEVRFSRPAAWLNAHALATAGTADVRTLRPAAKAVQDELDRFSAAYGDVLATLLRSKPEFDANPTPRADAVRWLHAADTLLATPPDFARTDPAGRASLVREFRRVSRQLLVTNETRPEPLHDVTPAKAREVAFEAAQRRGELLLARFGGPGLFAALTAASPGEGHAELASRLERFAFRADGRQSLALFGSRVGELLGALPSLAKPDAAADRWVRVAPAHADLTDEPIDRTRRARAREYLAFQAERTFTDHWAGEGDSRYYRLAVQRLEGDAKALAAALPPAPGLFDPAWQKEPQFPVAPMLPTRVAVTDEPNPAVKVPFVATKTSPVAGFATFDLVPGARAAVGTAPVFLGLVGVAPERKLVRPPLSQPPSPKAQAGALAVTGFFRGRTHLLSVPIDFYQVPHSTAVTVPPPFDIALAVRADEKALTNYGFGTGAVSIVLDCTGSMGRDPKDPKSVGLYPTALAALDGLLHGLPPGTLVNVWVLGPRTPGIRTPEEAIRELLPPVPVPPLPKDRQTLVADVLAKARGLEPWHESPIARTVVRAKDRIKDARVPFKAVVLISDCVDTRAGEDPDIGAKKREIADVLRAELPPADVRLAGVIIGDEQPEQKPFRDAAKSAPEGLFVQVKQANELKKKVDDLIAWLRIGLNARVRFTLQPLNSASVLGEGLMAGTPEQDNWLKPNLRPGRYELRVSGAETFRGEVKLRAGDRLLLDLKADGPNLSLSRHWFADTAPAVSKAGAPEGEWRLSLLQNRARGGELNLFAAIELNPACPASRDPTRATRIGDVWFEVKPSTANPAPVAVRWGGDGRFPTPAWAIDVPGWPNFPGSTAPTAPEVKAWWSPEPFRAAATLEPPASGVLTLAGRAVTVAGAAVTLESVAVEEHEVEVSPDTRVKRPWLVVRLSHQKDAPVFARPTGVEPLGREVRLYRDAGRTTCLYWWDDLTEADVRKRVSGLELVPLNDALTDAKANGRYLELTGPPPADTSARPDPVVK